MKNNTRILLADDHKLFAAGIERLLSNEPDFVVENVVHNGKEALATLEKKKVDLIITDMNMPGVNGLDILQYIKKKRWKVKTIVLSMYDDEEIFKKCIKQGVNANVLKNADPEELVYTIREVMEDRYLANFEHVLNQAEEGDEFEQYDHFKTTFKLSKRELEILRWIVKGKTNKEIAKELYLISFSAFKMVFLKSALMI